MEITVEETRTVQDIFDDIEEDYVNFMNSLNKFIEDIKDDFTPDR